MRKAKECGLEVPTAFMFGFVLKNIKKEVVSTGIRFLAALFCDGLHVLETRRKKERKKERRACVRP